MGPDRQGIPIRDRGRERLAGRPVQGALAAPRLPLHVRARLRGAGCPSCSAIADGFDGFAVHLANHDVMLWAVSRAPLAKLQAYKRRMGWTFPWASSNGGDFNFDFNVSLTEDQQRDGSAEYNYRRRGNAMDLTPVPEPVAQFAAACGTDAPTFRRFRLPIHFANRDSGSTRARPSIDEVLDESDRGLVSPIRTELLVLKGQTTSVTQSWPGGGLMFTFCNASLAALYVWSALRKDEYTIKPLWYAAGWRCIWAAWSLWGLVSCAVRAARVRRGYVHLRIVRRGVTIGQLEAYHRLTARRKSQTEAISTISSALNCIIEAVWN